MPERESRTVALLTERRYTAATAAEDDWYLANILRDDSLLIDALQSHGVHAERLAWCDPEVDWSRYPLAVFRTTWDYFERFGEFRDWLDSVELRTALCNDAATVRWNLDKHYLADLEAGGVTIVPSRFLEPGHRESLADVLTEQGWPDAVVKPCVSGAAWHTYRVGLANAAEVDQAIAGLRLTQAFLVQPFQHAIQSTGEITLVVLDGHVTHAVLKRPRAGDFRVQDDHGGTVEPHPPSAEEIAFAERAIAACPAPPAYGRVDLVRDNAGRLAVMEIELIEPELWLRFHPPAATTLARAIARRLETPPAAPARVWAPMPSTPG